MSDRLVGIVGSRTLPNSYAPIIFSLVEFFREQGYKIATGGALGADHYALLALLEQEAASSGVIYSAWSAANGFTNYVRPSILQFIAFGGKVIWGDSSPGVSYRWIVISLFARTRHMVADCSLIVAFMHGESRGTLYTIRHAIKKGNPVIVFLCGNGAHLPADLAVKCVVFDKVIASSN
jgi:hypothetical protein